MSHWTNFSHMIKINHLPKPFHHFETYPSDPPNQCNPYYQINSLDWPFWPLGITWLLGTIQPIWPTLPIWPKWPILPVWSVLPSSPTWLIRFIWSSWLCFEPSYHSHLFSLTLSINFTISSNLILAYWLTLNFESIFVINKNIYYACFQLIWSENSVSSPIWKKQFNHLVSTLFIPRPIEIRTIYSHKLYFLTYLGSFSQ